MAKWASGWSHAEARSAGHEFTTERSSAAGLVAPALTDSSLRLPFESAVGVEGSSSSVAGGVTAERARSAFATAPGLNLGSFGGEGVAVLPSSVSRM